MVRTSWMESQRHLTRTLRSHLAMWGQGPGWQGRGHLCAHAAEPRWHLLVQVNVSVSCDLDSDVISAQTRVTATLPQWQLCATSTAQGGQAPEGGCQCAWMHESGYYEQPRCALQTCVTVADIAWVTAGSWLTTRLGALATGGTTITTTSSTRLITEFASRQRVAPLRAAVAATLQRVTALGVTSKESSRRAWHVLGNMLPNAGARHCDSAWRARLARVAWQRAGMLASPMRLATGPCTWWTVAKVAEMSLIVHTQWQSTSVTHSLTRRD